MQLQRALQTQQGLPRRAVRSPAHARTSHAVRRRAPPAAAATAGDYGSSYGNSNLGALSRTVTPDAPAVEIDPYFSQRVSVESFANRGFAIDGGTAVVNGVLLLLLIALAGERIFGLDKVINRALLRWKESRVEARRYEVNDARQQLERQWSDSEDSGDNGSGSGRGDGGGSGGGGGGGGPPGGR